MGYVSILLETGMAWVNPRYVVSINETTAEITLDLEGCLPLRLPKDTDVAQLMERLDDAERAEAQPPAHCAMCCPRNDETGYYINRR